MIRFASNFCPPLLLEPLNELLATDTRYPVVEAAEGGQAPRLRRVRWWDNPKELLHPVAEAAANLICSRGLPADPPVRSVGLLVAVSGPDEGPRPSVVQHGGVWQPGQGGGAPGQEQERVILDTRWSPASVPFTLESPPSAPFYSRLVDWSIPLGITCHSA